MYTPWLSTFFLTSTFVKANILVAFVLRISDIIASLTKHKLSSNSINSNVCDITKTIHETKDSYDIKALSFFMEIFDRMIILITHQLHLQFKWKLFDHFFHNSSDFNLFGEMASQYMNVGMVIAILFVILVIFF